jgi:siroheme decarboxylase
VDMGDSLAKLTDFDRKLLHILQYEFPVSSRPFQDIANTLNVEEMEVLSFVRCFFQQGLIRRLGASINSRQVGYVSTLVALKVSPLCIDQVSFMVNKFPEITHNYLRDGEFNMWFTAIAPNQEKLDCILGEIEISSGVENLVSLPAKKIFKVNVKFPMVAG